MTSCQPRILLLGDSITQQSSDPSIHGFQTLLEADYIRRADIINRGLSGYNTRWFLMYLPQIIDEFRHQQAPALITLFLGANDADTSETQQVPIANYEENIKEIVRQLQAAFPTSSIILITPPCVGDILVFSRENNATGKYAAACQNAGKTLGIPVVDLWTPMQKKRESYLSDGLHLNGEGNRFVYKALTKTIAAHYPSLRPKALPFHYPEWKDLAEMDKQNKA